MLDNTNRAPGTLQIYVHRRNRGSWDPRDNLHHLVNLKNDGLSVNVMVDRSFRPLEPFPNATASASELDWVDVSSWLDPPTETDKEMLQLAHRDQEINHGDIDDWRLDKSKKRFGRGGLYLPCKGGNPCRIPGHGDCSDYSWLAGFYRALLHDLSERTVEREVMDSEFDSCKFCPDEILVEGVESRIMRVCLPKSDPNLRFH